VSEDEAAGGFTSVAVIYLAGLVGGAAINFVIPLLVLPGIWVRLVGLVPLVLGACLFAWARATFRRQGTALMPWKPSSELVRDGPFGFSRNPIYLSFSLIYLAAALIFDSVYILVMLVVAVVLFDRTQIPREERYLQERFGGEFSEYRTRVRRWI